jgi:hypothetical protein
VENANENFGKKIKVEMQTKTKIPRERMQEMKTKLNNISSLVGVGGKRNKSEWVHVMLSIQRRR